MRLPGVQQASAWYGNEIWPMRRNGDLFTVDVPARPGFAIGDGTGGILGFNAGD
jgi:hypothetical protein